MHKRRFIQLSSTIMAAPILSQLSGLAQEPPLTNWAGNLTYSTNNISYPSTVQQVQETVRASSSLKVLGTRHCFNTIADSSHRFIGLRNMNKVLSLDAAAQTVTVEGGIRYGELSPWLHSKGYALHNLASLPHIAITGACATATHGSGVRNGNLATAVTGMELVKADGSIGQVLEQESDLLQAAVVGLGALGVVTKITLRVQPAYEVRQYVYERLPLAELKANFNAIMAAGYSVSLFTDWQQEHVNEVWIKCRADEQACVNGKEPFYGAVPATRNMHPIAELSAENCTEQMGVAGPWYERLPHFKMGFTPSSGKELQAEYFVPQHHAVDAFFAIQKMGKAIGPHLFISEIRTVAADNCWMSPCYQEPGVAIHFTWKQEWDAVIRLLPLIEQELGRFNTKPHWGKLFTMPYSTLSSRYSKMKAFKQLVADYDPTGKFRNAFLSANLYGS